MPFTIKLLNKEYSIRLQPPQNSSISYVGITNTHRKYLKVTVSLCSNAGEGESFDSKETNISELKDRSRTKNGYVLDLPISYDDFKQVTVTFIFKSQNYDL